MHVLVTGMVQVGKSTAIDKFLKRAGVSADGFRTFWKYGDYRTLHMRNLWDNTSVMIATEETGRLRPVPEAFDTFGKKLVEESGKGDITVLDELGRLELRSPDFCAAVLKRLQDIRPVIAVIKPEHNEFLDAVRSITNTVIIEVTPEKRESIPYEIGRALKMTGADNKS